MISTSSDPLLLSSNSLGLQKTKQADASDLWQALLSNTTKTKLPPHYNLLLLGENQPGKRAVFRNLARKSGQETINLNLALSFATTNVKENENYTENVVETQMSSNAKSDYILDQDSAVPTAVTLDIYTLTFANKFTKLLRAPLVNHNSKTFALVVLDWTKPWDFVNELYSWISEIEKVVATLRVEERAQLKDHAAKTLNNVVPHPEPLSDPTVTDSSKPTDSLTFNIPLIVICTRAEHISVLEKQYNYTEKELDFIQQTLRTVCLAYNASLFYISNSHPSTYTTLRAFIGQLIGIPHHVPIKPQVADKEQVAVPASWDSYGKIRVLKEQFDCEGMNPVSSPGGWAAVKQQYNHVIPNLSTSGGAAKTQSSKATVQALDEQVFLQDCMEKLFKGKPESHITTTFDHATSMESFPASTVSSSLLSTTSNATAPSTTSSQNEVLANFFQSLLQKPSVGSSSPTSSSTNVRKDAAAQLDQMRRKS